MTAPLLAIDDLVIEFHGDDGDLRAVDGVSFEIWPGEVVALVGESGSGKTLTSLSIGGLLPPPSLCSVRGSIRMDGRELLGLPQRELRHLRGRDIAYVFQDPLTSFNPIQRVRDQVAEAVLAHQPAIGNVEAGRVAIGLLDMVGIPNLPDSARLYPHEFSGGMRQRVMIAMAMAHRPRLLVADEPTTALDVTVQAQVLETLETARKSTGTAVLFITHDMGLVAQVANRVVVMYAGRVAEIGEVNTVLKAPRHPYTRALLASVPDLARRRARLIQIPGQPPDLHSIPGGCPFHPRCQHSQSVCASEVPLLARADAPGHAVACHFWKEILPDVAPESNLGEPDPVPAASGSDMPLEVRRLEKHFTVGSTIFGRTSSQVHAVDSVSFAIPRGSTLALVGESGCGKTTLARTVVRLLRPTAGEILLMDRDITHQPRRRLRRLGAQIQFVFQDPHSSIDPRMRVRDVVGEPLRANRRYSARRIAELLEMVGLSPSHSLRFPHELSGGQRQRVVIARALALRPAVLVLDEPLSSLDVSIQAQILNLLIDLRAELQLTCLFISHNLAVVNHLADQVAVMYLGKLVEVGPTEAILGSPAHPYTRALLSAVPSIDPDRRGTRIVLEGDVPSPVNPPTGCRFRTRCWKAETLCAEQEPELIDRGVGRLVACHFPERRAEGGETPAARPRSVSAAPAAPAQGIR